MSQFMPDVNPETAGRVGVPERGNEAYLSPDERKFWQRGLGFPEDFPPKFRSWLIDFIAVNIPQIPISQVVGANQFTFKLLDQAEITSTVRVNNTIESSPDTIITGNPVDYDGKPLLIVFNAPKVDWDFSGRNLTLNLWEDSTDRGRFGGASVGDVEGPNSLTVVHRYTPPAGSHTFSVRGWINTGFADIVAGAGGAGTTRPAQLTIFSMPNSA